MSSSASEPAGAVAKLQDWARDRLGLDDTRPPSRRRRKSRSTDTPSSTTSAAWRSSSSASRSRPGILLLLYYRPSSSEAFESVQYMMADVPFGWLIRSIHSWGANLFVGVVVLPPDLRLLPEGLPRAARSDVDHRGRAPLPDDGLRLLRVSPPLEHALLLRDEGRDRRAGADPRHRSPALAHPARRLGRHRRDAVAVLRSPRRDPARDHDGASSAFTFSSCSGTA